MKVFITIALVAMFMLILRVYYEKQIEGFENNNSEEDSDSETEEEVSLSPPMETDNSTETDSLPETEEEVSLSPPMETDNSTENKALTKSKDKMIDATKILRQINDIIPPDLVDKISRQTSANILNPEGLESEPSKITKNTAPITDEHGDLCNCDKCIDNVYIHQTFNTYYDKNPKNQQKKTRPNVRAGGTLADEHENINFFLDKMMTEFNDKSKKKNLNNYATKVKPYKKSKPKYAKHESVTGMFTDIGPSAYNSCK